MGTRVVRGRAGEGGGGGGVAVCCHFSGSVFNHILHSPGGIPLGKGGGQIPSPVISCGGGGGGVLKCID